MTVGERNRNPLNVKGAGWRGQFGSDPRGHAIFLSVPYGIRAAIVTLRTYRFAHGLNTVAAILSRWAPSSDTVGSIPGAPANSPTDYTRFVCKRLGIEPTAALDLFEGGTRKVANPDRLFALLAAMAIYENRAGYTLHRADFETALSLL